METKLWTYYINLPLRLISKGLLRHWVRSILIFTNSKTFLLISPLKMMTCVVHPILKIKFLSLTQSPLLILMGTASQTSCSLDKIPRDTPTLRSTSSVNRAANRCTALTKPRARLTWATRLRCRLSKSQISTETECLTWSTPGHRLTTSLFCTTSCILWPPNRTSYAMRTLTVSTNFLSKTRWNLASMLLCIRSQSSFRWQRLRALSLVDWGLRILTMTASLMSWWPLWIRICQLQLTCLLT